MRDNNCQMHLNEILFVYTPTLVCLLSKISGLILLYIYTAGNFNLKCIHFFLQND